MAEKTGIEWCDATFNPWWGCQAVSDACTNCYAQAMVERFGGDFSLRRRTSPANWKQPLAWNRKAAAAGVRKRVFCASMADVFDNKVPAEWRADLWRLIGATPHLDWLLLTKRPQNIRDMMPAWCRSGFDFIDTLPNVWLGTTVENQTEAERRIPHLLAVPAVVRFLSCEPLLGAVDLNNIKYQSGMYGWLSAFNENAWPELGRIHWVIAGGESGPHARDTTPALFRSLRDQCKGAGVAFFMKQMARKAPIPDDLMVREFPL